MTARSRPAWPPLLLQIALVLGGVTTLALYPPREGAMALIALDGRDAGRIVQPALIGGASLLARGPLSNMLIVRGNRERLAGPLLARGILVMAAPSAWCGAAGSRV